MSSSKPKVLPKKEKAVPDFEAVHAESVRKAEEKARKEAALLAKNKEAEERRRQSNV